MSSTSGPRLALLVCDTPLPSIVAAQGAYPIIFTTWLLASARRDMKLQLDPYDVVHKEYPDPENYDGILITGSAASAYEETDWVLELVKFVRLVIDHHPKVKIIGICFGHQIIAQALGGPDSVRRNELGWEAGVYTVSLTPAGERVFSEKQISIHEMHRDHVVRLPPGCINLGSTDKCEIQGLVKLYDTSKTDAALPENFSGADRQTDSNALATGLPTGNSSTEPTKTEAPSTASSVPEEINLAEDVHILSVQGHPEFTSFMVTEIVKTRGEKGIMPPETVKDSMERASRKHDGDGMIGEAIWKVLGL